MTSGGRAGPPQRIGLSATQRPLETIARYLGGVGPGREVAIVDAGTRKPLELQVVVPIEDMTAPGEVLPLDQQPGGPATNPEARTSIWPAIHPKILELIRAHRSTIVFTNSRRLAERLAQRLNELAGEELVRAHHGSTPGAAGRDPGGTESGALPSCRHQPPSSASTWAPSTVIQVDADVRGPRPGGSAEGRHQRAPSRA